MSDASCICISLRKASRKLTAQYDDALASVGINLAQFSLLRNVNRHGPVSLTRLGEITELDRSTLGRNIRVLERMGLCAMTHSEDKREASIALTPDGKRTLDIAVPHWQAAQDAIHGKIGALGAAQLEALLGAL